METLVTLYLVTAMGMAQAPFEYQPVKGETCEMAGNRAIMELEGVTGYGCRVRTVQHEMTMPWKK